MNGKWNTYSISEKEKDRIDKERESTLNREKYIYKERYIQGVCMYNRVNKGVQGHTLPHIAGVDTE